MKPTIIFTIFLLFASRIIAQDTIRVPQDYQTIQEAFDNAESESTILVGPGTYFENIIWEGDKTKVKLISEQGSANTIIDGQDQARCIRVRIELEDGAEISGFTIQHGLAFPEEFGSGRGGGLFLRGRAKLSDLIIQNNKIPTILGYGIGACLYEFIGTVENCQFINNSSIDNAVSGIGLYVRMVGDVELNNVLFFNNTHVKGNVRGRAFYVSKPNSFEGFPFDGIANLTIRNCTFENNSGGVFSNNNLSGAACYFGGDRPLENIIIDSCLFKKNESYNSAATTDGGAILINSLGHKITNCVFEENSATGGGAICFFGGGLDKPTVLRNCIFKNNQINNGWAGVEKGSAFNIVGPVGLDLYNCIFDNNEKNTIKYGFSLSPTNINFEHCAFINNGEPPFFHDEVTVKAINSIFWDSLNFLSFQETDDFEFSNCIVKGGIDGDFIIDTDPLFNIDSIYSLSTNSPCIDGGLREITELSDLYGNPRPNPSIKRPDIGPIEDGHYNVNVNVQFYRDLNENGTRDSDEYLLSYGNITLNDTVNIQNIKQDGIDLFLSEGLVKIKYAGSNNANWNLTSSVNVYNYNFDSTIQNEIIEFGLAPIEEKKELHTLITGDNFRCGESIQFVLTLSNFGTDRENGIVWLEYDEKIENIIISSQPDTILSQNKLGWFFENLLPFENRHFEINFVAPIPNAGTEVFQVFNFSSDIENLNQSDSGFQYSTELRCAFDPNDKLVYPNREDSLTLIDEPIIYTIRFQNTGNDFARNVLVIDTLHESLNLNTFRLLNSSHPEILELSILENNIIKFDFPNIFLPDSLSNFEESNGHISFSILSKDDTPEDEIITNSASIYFDFNPPIHTNKTNNKIIYQFPTSFTDNFNKTEFKIFPNPTNGIIYFNHFFDQLDVFDVNGILHDRLLHSDYADLSNLYPGIYFLKISDEEKSIQQKMLIKN